MTTQLQLTIIIIIIIKIVDEDHSMEEMFMQKLLQFFGHSF